MQHTLSRRRRTVALWLLLVAGVILAMITVGGLTRITGSGLSITEWDPIMGVVPPIGGAEWQDAFAKYQRIPQYLHEHAGMTLDDFMGHETGGGSRGRYLKGWKKRRTPEVRIWLHTRSMFHALWPTTSGLTISISVAMVATFGKFVPSPHPM